MQENLLLHAKIFSSDVKHFWILGGVGKCRILIGLCKQASLIAQPYFSNNIIKES